MTFIRGRLRIAGRDAGYALALVLGIGLVLMLVVVTATSFSIASFKSARNDQDWNAALAAAYAGVDEYQSRLTNDSSYGRYGNPASTFSIATGSATGLTLPTVPNPAFNVNASQPWASIVGSGESAQFRYEVDNSNFSNSGKIRVRSTGKVGNVTRSVVADLKGKGFIDYLWFTDFEMADPALTPGCQYPTTYGWQRATYRTGCTEITFSSNDTLDGPVHSNDIMHICDAEFTSKVTTLYKVSPYYSRTSGKWTDADGRVQGGGSCDGQDIPAGYPQIDDSVTMPKTNGSLRFETEVGNPRDVPRPGCLYTGPTSITFLSNGDMIVKSPWTKWPHGDATKRDSAAGVVLTDCGTPGTGSNSLGSSTGARVPVPNNNLIFVQAATRPAGDPNYWADNATPPLKSANSASGFTGCWGSNLNQTSANGQIRVAGNGLGYPQSKSITKDSKTRVVNEKPPVVNAYACREGDLFTEGVVRGRVTVVSSNYTYLTGNLTYTSSADDGDMLGIVGGKSIWVLDPVLEIFSQRQNNTTTEYTTSNEFIRADADRTIQAAMLSVSNTFTVQNYTLPSGSNNRGQLFVTGAIAQKYRGAVALGGTTGYAKKYSYDKRFVKTAPPKFLAPVATTYGVTSYADVSAGFTVKGANNVGD